MSALVEREATPACCADPILSRMNRTEWCRVCLRATNKPWWCLSCDTVIDVPQVCRCGGNLIAQHRVETGVL